jgi:aldehyde dehydrogenase (NAD+)
MDDLLPQNVSTLTFYNWIDGSRVESVDGRQLDVLCPSDGRVFATIPRSGPDDVDKAVCAAWCAFEGG